MFGADRAPMCLRPNTVSIVAGPGGERRMARRLSALPAASRTGKRGAPEDAPREVHPREGVRPARSCWTPRLRNTFFNTFRAVIRVPVRQKLIMSGNVRFSTGRIPQSRFGVVLAAQTRRPCTQRLAPPSAHRYRSTLRAGDHQLLGLDGARLRRQGSVVCHEHGTTC